MTFFERFQRKERWAPPSPLYQGGDAPGRSSMAGKHRLRHDFRAGLPLAAKKGVEHFLKIIDGRSMTTDHEHFMQMAIDEAEKAARMEEVPVGAVLVDGQGNLIASDHNRTICNSDPSGHAEMNVLRAAGRALQNYRLLSTTLYVTIEPCAMCMGAIVHARVKTVVFGACDPKWGAACSLYQLGQDMRLNHQVEVIPGICEQRCRGVIQDFFRDRRKRRTGRPA